MIEFVQIDVRQKRAYHRPLRRAPFAGAPSVQTVHNSCFQILFNQSQYTSVTHFLPQAVHEPSVRNGVEVSLYIRIHYPCASLLQQAIYTPQRVFGSPPRAKPVGVFTEGVLENRFEHVPQGSLYYAVAHVRDTQRALFGAARLLDPCAPHRSRRISPLAQLLPQLFQTDRGLALKVRYTASVRSGGSAVAPHLVPRGLKVARVPYFVDQAEPLSSLDPSFEGHQHRFCPHRRFGPRLDGAGLSALFTRCRN